MTEPDILVRMRRGDHAAFEAIFRAWYQPVVWAANRIVHEQDVAEEVAQDVFLELWRRRETLPDGSSMAGYLIQASRNRALNHLRHLVVRAKTRASVEALSEPVVQSDLDMHVTELETAIRNTIAQLPPRAREVFLMSRERNLRNSEIAEALGITIKAVEANMSRALKQLRLKLAPFLDRDG